MRRLSYPRRADVAGSTFVLRASLPSDDLGSGSRKKRLENFIARKPICCRGFQVVILSTCPSLSPRERAKLVNYEELRILLVHDSLPVPADFCKDGARIRVGKATKDDGFLIQISWMYQFL